jgi:protein-disulfide isomerase
VKNKVILIVVTVLTLIASFAIIWKLYQDKKNEEYNVLARLNFEKFVPDYAPRLGPSNPRVFLVEFLDPECESCREFYPMVKMILEEFEGQVQLVVRYAPFHPNSKFAIKILEASRKQGKYWETLQVLFSYQPQWGSHHNPQPELIWKFLPEAGVDVERIRKDMNDPEIDKILIREVQDVTDLGVRATPTFFANGEQLQTFSYEALRELVRKKIEEEK